MCVISAVMALARFANGYAWFYAAAAVAAKAVGMEAGSPFLRKELWDVKRFRQQSPAANVPNPFVSDLSSMTDSSVCVFRN